MLTSEAVNYFGTQAQLANILGISQAAISKWGCKVPKQRAYQLQVITCGVLKANDDDDDFYFSVNNLQNTSIKGLMKNDHAITD